MLYGGLFCPAAVITTVSLTHIEIQNFWVSFSASSWNNLSDMPITARQQAIMVKNCMDGQSRCIVGGRRLEGR